MGQILHGSATRRDILGRAVAPGKMTRRSARSTPAHVRRQVRLDPLPTAPSLRQKRFLRTVPIPFPKRIRIVLSEQKD